MHHRSKITVVVPALNEEGTLRRMLLRLSIGDNEELVIVDGMSQDRTLSIAREFTERVFTSDRGRARQMNLGAQKAAGEVLLFLHADCILPGGAFDVIRSTLEDTRISAGAFDLSIEHPGRVFRLIESCANLRSHMLSVPYGDQGLFMRKQVFERVGGFADIPLMEDIEIVSRLKKVGAIRFVRPPVKASPRRWLKEGILKTTLRDWGLAFSYSVLGISPQKLIKFYKDVR